MDLFDYQAQKATSESQPLAEKLRPDQLNRFMGQQDAFLHHVESGLITLIGATTENPSFEVITPLLSRCRVIIFEALTHNSGMLAVNLV